MLHSVRGFANQPRLSTRGYPAILHSYLSISHLVIFHWDSIEIPFIFYQTAFLLVKSTFSIEIPFASLAGLAATPSGAASFEAQPGPGEGPAFQKWAPKMDGFIYGRSDSELWVSIFPIHIPSEMGSSSELLRVSQPNDGHDFSIAFVKIRKTWDDGHDFSIAFVKIRKKLGWKLGVPG